MGNHVNRRSDFSQRFQYRGGHDDIGKLGHSRIGEQSFDICLAQCHQARDDDGEGGGIQQPGTARRGKQMFDAEYVDDDFGDAENTGLDDRDGMQQCTDRSRCDHRGGKPAMYRHDGSFTDAEHKQSEKQSECRSFDVSGEYAARRESTVTGNHISPDDSGQ